MRPLSAALLLLILPVAACSSTRAKSPVTAPDVRIVQTSGIPAAARHMEGSVQVRYTIRVENRAAEAITLRRVTAVSMGAGAYSLGTTSLPYDQVVEPKQSQEVEFWGNAIASGTILGSNGPVTLRLILHFESPLGEFDEIVVQQVNAMGGGTEPR